MEDHILIFRVEDMTEEECHELVHAIMDIIKIRNIATYEVKFGNEIG